MKKLVELDPISMCTKEFDLVKITRSGNALKQYLLQLAPKEDVYRIKDQVLSIVEQALAGNLDLPFDVRRMPLQYESREDLLPSEYKKLAAPFLVSIAGMSGLGSDLLRPVLRDDKPYVFMEFEEQ